jgi:hypothetical protein
MSTPKQLLVSKRKLFLAFISIALICCISTGSLVYVSAQDGSTPFTISSGPYPGAPNWTIYLDNGVCYAKNQYGAVIYSSIDASVVWNSIMTVVTNGSKIQFTSGIFNFMTQTTNVTVPGLEMGDVDTTPYFDASGTILRARFTGTYLFTFNFIDHDQSSFYIHDITLNSIGWGAEWATPPYTVGGIYVANSGWYTIEQVKIEGFVNYGIYIFDGGQGRILHSVVSMIKNTDGIVMDNCADWQMYDIETDCYGQAENMSAIHIINHSYGQIIGGHIEGFRGIEVDVDSNADIQGLYMPSIREVAIWFRSGTGNRVIGCTIFSNANGYTGIRGSGIVSDLGYCHVESTSIGLGGTTTYAFYSAAPYNQLIGGRFYPNIYIYYTTVTGARLENVTMISANKVEDNIILGTVTWGSGDTVRNNIGYKTEIQGLTHIDSGQAYVDVTHDLVGYPTYIQVTPNSNCTFYTTNLNATAIRLYTTVSVGTDTYFWYKIEYQPS